MRSVPTDAASISASVPSLQEWGASDASNASTGTPGARIRSTAPTARGPSSWPTTTRQPAPSHPSATATASARGTSIERPSP